MNRLRTLDGFEEQFWFKEHFIRCGHALATEISGTTSAEEWHNAVKRLQGVNPLLRASIHKVDGERPFFSELDVRPELLNIQPLTPAFSLTAQTEKVLSQCFRDGDPLIRIYLFYGSNRSFVLLHSHHAALDGLSHLFLLGALLNYLHDKTEPAVQSLHRPISDLVDRPIPPYRQTTPEGVVAASGPMSSPEAHQLYISTLNLTQDETSELVARAKFELCSVHSVMVGALAAAGCELHAQWRNSPVRCLSPFDLRRLFNLGDQIGQLIALHRSSLAISCVDDFWDSAREITISMTPDRLREELHSFVKTWESMTEYERSLNAGWPIPATSPFAHDLMLTSYGAYPIESHVGHLRVLRLFTAGFSGGPETQKFSTLTLDGSLGITHVSPAPFPRMLPAVKEMLTEILK